MARINPLNSIWDTVKEVDLRPIRQEALDIVSLILVGEPGSGRAELAEQMRRDPSRPEEVVQSPLPALNPDNAGQAALADLILVVVDARADDHTRTAELVKRLSQAGPPVLVVMTHVAPSENLYGPAVSWGQRRVVYGDVANLEFLQNEFAPAVVDLLPNRLVSLARHYPLFRVEAARRLISETCFSNAAYSLSTGLAEVVPVLNIPLNVADMVILTKAQAFLVYRLGLALGFSTRWQDYIAEFGSVLGSGFLWRQFARGLIGLIPAFGILPKVAVAYAGTYVVGMVVLRWYLTGRHLNRAQLQDLYKEALERGKTYAKVLLARLPRPFRRKSPLPLLGRGKKKLPADQTKTCPECGQENSADARFCQYCGHVFKSADTITGPDEETASS
ncbi:MAG TPA: zinc ribbon domain-containing protein [Anaerolineales bacterium]|nr:zinc ribbon domain-containing protein [Anaerolineales bacterium]